MWTVRNEMGCAAEEISARRSSETVATAKKQKTKTGRARSTCAAVELPAVHKTSSAMQSSARKARVLRKTGTVRC